MPTKTRPLARFGYLAFAPLLFFSRNSRFSPAITASIGHTRRSASDLDHESAVQIWPVAVKPASLTISVAMRSPPCQNQALALF